MSDNSISTEMSTDSSKEKGSQSRGATGIDADRALTVSLEKVGQGIALQWLGEDEREYVIYKCTTPRFDTCTVVTEVQGPGWVDREAEIGGVIYYKVELKS